MTTEEAQNLLDEYVLKLREHFGAVQIMVAWELDGGGTKCTKRGAGLWHARIGMAHEFINSNLAADQADYLAQKLNPPDDGDNWKATT